MDFLTFIVEITKALAWPFVVAWVVWLLREPLASIPGAIKQLKYKDFEISFKEKIERLQKQAKITAATEQSPDAHNTFEEVEYLKILIKETPGAAVLAVWAELEKEMESAISKLPTDTSNSGRGATMEGTLYKHGVIEANEYELIRSLRELRNQVAHSPGAAISSESAWGYAMSGKFAIMSLHAE